MKIAIFGILPFSGLIKEGFQILGHTISNENPDLIYANDPRGYKEAISLKKKHPTINMIFNLLDIPWFMPNILSQTKMLVNTYLNQADAIHPNAEGVAEIVNRIRPMILQLIDGMR